MDVHDRRGMEVSRRQARPVRGDEAKKGNEDEYAPHHDEKASWLNPRRCALQNGRFHGSLPDQYFAGSMRAAAPLDQAALQTQPQPAAARWLRQVARHGMLFAGI